ncbi:hypothetical protein [Salinicoccus carnicancri]|uniref:hypothetical protein n=1 Tax=Salinicoccus carnicancri TaxID=558170 RepID=UPI0002E76A8E|nr:hypothetical protein [Salinicoccus carnicancri]
MKILAAGGIYIDMENTDHIETAGGFKIASLIGRYSRNETHIHTNFSTEETKITGAVKKSLHADGVDTRRAGKVSAAYGRLYDSGFDAGSNNYETVKSDRRYGHWFRDADVFVLSTDIAERDFRVLMAVANNNDIETHVFTCGEYPVTGRRGNVHIHALDGTEHKKPDYHNQLDAIMAVLAGAGIIGRTPVERGPDDMPGTALHDAGRFFLQIVSLAVAAALVILSGMMLLELGGPGEEYETDIDWQQPVEHADCATIEECKETGDRYLDDLSEYIDIDEEPHIFIENRSRTDYITYRVDDELRLADPAHENTLPVGTEEEFREIWDMFTAIIPPERLATVTGFDLFSDGEGNTLAYVDIQTDGTTLGVDIRDNTSRAAQYRTLIHEYGHIHSLPAGDFTDGCGTELDCLERDALLGAYIERFWSQYDEKWLENKYKSDPEKEAFFNNNAEDFYVPYQALNPKEDYAVTFTAFITGTMPETSRPADVKVRSFYEDPDLAALRVDILKNLLAYEEERASDET